MRTLTGTIALVQESRFRLVTDAGRSKLFILSHDAPLEPQDLPALQRRGERVSVAYTPADGLHADVAHDIRRPNYVLPHDDRSGDAP